MLDLTHSLRIWVEMAEEIDDLVESKNFETKFLNPTKNKQHKKVLKDTPFILVPLTSAPQISSGMQVKGLRITNRCLSPQEMERLYKAHPSRAKTVKLSFQQWLGSEVLETKTDQGKRIGISRLILVKRVANILGASHPKGKENENEYEGHFDPFVKELHRTEVANGCPLTYYQLIEIAKNIVENFKELLE